MEELINWTIEFVKHRDIWNKNLESYSVDKHIISFKFKNSNQNYIVLSDLTDECVKFKDLSDSKGIVCLAKKSNLKFLLNKWSEFKQKSAVVIFVDLNTSSKLLINPFIHSKICDDSALESGLASLYENAFEL